MPFSKSGVFFPLTPSPLPWGEGAPPPVAGDACTPRFGRSAANGSPSPQGHMWGSRRFHGVRKSEPVAVPEQMPSHPALVFGRSVGGLRESLGLEELQVTPRQCGFQATDIGVPFDLHGVHRADELFEGVQSPAPLHEGQGAFPMGGGRKRKRGGAPQKGGKRVEGAYQAGAPGGG